MKKSKSIFAVVIATLLVVVLCTWIFPSASFNATLVEGEKLQVGLFDLLSYPMVALTYFGYVLIYTLVVGMFYGVANKIPAYHVLIEKIKKLYTGKEAIFLAIVMILLAIIVSVTGVSFAMIFVFPFIISVVLAMGYNKLVAASVTVGPVVAGIAGTTLGNSTVNYMHQILGVNIMDEMISKVVVLVAFTIVLVANVLLYAKKTKNSTIEAEVVTSSKKVEKEEVKEVPTKKEKETSKKSSSKKEDTKKSSTKKSTAKKATTKKTTKSKATKASMAKNSDEVLKVKSKEKKPKCWPFVVVFDLTFIILCLAVFDWAGVFEITWFADAKEAINNFEVMGFPIFSKLLGNYYEFGAWSFNIEIPALIMVATLILALIYRVKWSDLTSGVESGIKKAIKPAILMTFIYVILIVSTYHPFQLIITKFILELTSGLNVVTMSIVAMVASLFNVDIIYVAQSTLPYVMNVIGKSELYPLIGVIFQAIYGLMMLVLPSSIILFGTLSYLDISYGQWLKHIWKVFVEILVVLLIIFLIILAI